MAVQLSTAYARKVARAVRIVLGEGSDQTGRRSRRNVNAGREFWAKIGDHAAIATDDDNRWRYAWTEQRPTAGGWEDLPDGRSGTTDADYALNGVEANNAHGGTEGNSIDHDAPDYPATSGLHPVRGTPVVRMTVEPSFTDGVTAVAYRFEYVNSEDPGAAGCPDDEMEPVSLAGTDLTADATTWTLGTDANTLYDTRVVRVVWDGTGAVLYGFTRTYTYACGVLQSVSAETRVTIDSPDLCPAP